MTRFARSKGSKASNERLPESATSWSEMKQDLLNKNKDLEEKQKREEAVKQRQANYQAFLQEREEEEEKKITWADFPGANAAGNKTKPSAKRKASTSNDVNSFKKNKIATDSIQLNGNDDNNDSDDSDGQFSNLKSQIDKILDKQKEGDSDSDDAPPEEVSIKEKPQEIIVKKPKKPIKQKLKIVLDKEKQFLSDVSTKKSTQLIDETDDRGKAIVNTLIDKKYERQRKQAEKKKLKKQQQKKLQKGENPNSVAPKQENADPEKLQKKLERRKKQKDKKKIQHLEEANVELEKPENLSEKELKKILKKKERRARQAEKRKVIREAKALEAEKNDQNSNEKNQNDENRNKLNAKRKFNEPDQSQEFTERKPFQKPQNNQKQKPGKQRDNKQHPSRKQKPEVMFINGKTVEVDYIDGFPVKKEDADRLKKLRKEMISKGLPRSEINVSLKLERRRAEKAFAREKKNVCFNCRKSGHNLSECPELDKNQVVQSAGTGICFKCGSTEHTHFECKVVKGLDYKFATCFICKEQGHIAKQCPDNQRGLYPKGGSCKVCGDVTHLKKDCPKYQAQQSQLQSSLSIGTIDNGNPDDLGSRGPNNSFPSGPSRKLNKVIKF